MSKLTVYAHHLDKDALFRAAVRRAIEAYTVPREAIDAVVSDALEATLKAIARLRIANLSQPVANKLQRILAAQAYCFTEPFPATLEEGAGPTDLVTFALVGRPQATGQQQVK